MSTYVMTITIKTRWSTKISWIMGGRRGGLRPISTSLVAIDAFSNIEQRSLTDILRPNSMACAITSTISFLGVIVDVLGPVSNYPITTNSFSCNIRWDVSGLFIDISTFIIINSDIILLFFMDRFLYTMWRYWWSRQYTMVTLVTGASLDVLISLYIHIYLQHQPLFPDFKRKGGWSLVSYIWLYKHILRDYERNSGWSKNTYSHYLHK